MFCTAPQYNGKFYYVKQQPRSQKVTVLCRSPYSGNPVWPRAWRHSCLAEDTPGWLQERFPWSKVGGANLGKDCWARQSQVSIFHLGRCEMVEAQTSWCGAAGCRTPLGVHLPLDSSSDFVRPACSASGERSCTRSLSAVGSQTPAFPCQEPPSTLKELLGNE